MGLEPTSSALRGRCPARRASPASFSSSQCWCRANSTGGQSPGPLPRAWPEIQSQRRGSNPHAPLYKKGARPVELHWRCLAGVDSRLRSGTATVTGSHAATTPYPPSVGLVASIPVRSRTSPSTFARSRAAGTLRGQPSVPRPGVEPGPAPSEGAMMSLSPPGQPQWTVEGVELSSAGCKPAVFPLDDTPRNQGSGPGGTRTHIVPLKRRVLSRLSDKSGQCVGQELNLHSACGWVTATWARRCPADTSCQYPGWELNPRFSP